MESFKRSNFTLISFVFCSVADNPKLPNACEAWTKRSHDYDQSTLTNSSATAVDRRDVDMARRMD